MSSGERTARNRSGLWVCAFVFAVSAFFLFARIGSSPIVLWDESRLAVNAIEMWLSGRLFVTTYNFQPDLWNTKPPLLIWLMTASMHLFGPSEWAVRLPSALAALATLAITMIFTWRLTRSGAAACLAGVALVASSGFYGRHAAATGDYDALLTMCTTGYLCVLFFAIHRRAPPRRWVVTAGLLIAAAILTKGVAGVIPGAGAAVYLVAVRRWRRPFQSPWYAAGAAIVLAAAGGFYIGRELAAPGYLHAVLRNELGGRYLNTIAGHHRPFTFFLETIFVRRFSGGPLLLLVPFAAVIATGRQRLGILFAGCVAATVVLVFSLSATKLSWYILPAYPFMAIAVALSLRALAQRVTAAHGRTILAGRWSPRAAEALLLILSAALVAVAVLRYEPLSDDTGTRPSRYDVVFAELWNRGIRAVDVVEGGDANGEGFVHYAPRLRFYELLWGARSLRVQEIAPDLSTLDRDAGHVVVTCDQHYVNDLRHRGELVAAVAGCVSVRP